jgi:hypothetical protein
MAALLSDRIPDPVEKASPTYARTIGPRSMEARSTADDHVGVAGAHADCEVRRRNSLPTTRRAGPPS